MNNNERRILIVDDDPNNLELMMRILGEDYRLAFATSGVEALEVTKRLSPDIILLDIMMPEMDGYETCRRLKADLETCKIPVIFITAKGETEDEKMGLDLGAIDYLTKPVSAPIVKARIRNHMAFKIAREEIEQKNILLREKNKELVKAARLREDVERMSRHDLKTPLNAIITLPRIMLEDPDLSNNHFQFLEIMEKAGLQMLNMINLSLDLFKMERGMYILTPDRMDILRILHQIIGENRQIMVYKELDAVIRINGFPVGDKERFHLYGEHMLCYSMLANLIKNAFEASPEKERVEIDISEEDDAGVIRIHNKGAVAADIRSRFFEKYVTFGKASGTGLGAYSAKLIAQTHGGKIDMDTSDKNGTTITVRLPLIDTGEHMVGRDSSSLELEE